MDYGVTGGYIGLGAESGLRPDGASKGYYSCGLSWIPRKRGLPSPDRADACAIAFAGRANAAPMNVESHAGGSTRVI
jgi:hypothetical protein